MSELHTLDGRRVVEIPAHAGDLPALSRLDRLALRIGIALILRAQRRVERHIRVHEARPSDGARQAALQSTFERRVAAGTVW